ncbi:MAG: hypothetical protein JWP97_3128 [Labilithrix sp.]|nr:hypothetical protein [Labilithrix sp.]
MDTFERIELRRFVGRELLLWLWFESELFEATLKTKAHGSFGFWLEGRLVLSAGQETTSIKGSQPGNHREAKEALLRGKLPDLAQVHLSWADHEATFTLKAEKLAIAGLKLPRKEKEAGDAPGAVASLTRIDGPVKRARPKRAAQGKDAEAILADDEAHEAFYTRMTVTREIETIVEALYRDFLALRLGPAWDAAVAPALGQWSQGEDVDVDAYAKARARALR